MIIRKIKLVNIRSYENAEIEFPYGSVLLSGDIGTGKTSVLLAIEFALFGLQPGQKGASLLRNGEKEGLVSLELEIDGRIIVIERTLKRGKSVSQEFASISIDNEKKELSVTELKNLVLSLINYPSEFAKKTNLLYRFTVYTPQEEMKQIILEEPEERLNILRHVFGIDKYKRIRENTDIFTAKLREEIRTKKALVSDLDEKNLKKESKVQEIEKLNFSIQNTEKEFIVLTEQSKKKEKDLKEVEEKIQEKKKFESEIEKTIALLVGKKELSFSLTKDEERINSQLEEAKKIPFSEQQLEEKEKEIEQLKQKENDLNKKYLDLSSQINSLILKNSESDKLKSSISRLQHCPTCLQDVNPVYRANIMNKFDNEISENKKLVLALNEEKEKTSSELDKIKSTTTKTDREISEMKLTKVKLEGIKEKQERLKEIEKQKVFLEKDFQILESHVTDLKSRVLEFSKYDNIFEERNKELKEALKIEKEAEISLATIKKEIEMTKKEILSITEEIEKKELTKKELEHITELEDWLSSQFLELVAFTEKNVMLKLKEEFSKLFNEWFNILVPDIFTVRLDEDFTPIIEQQDYELDYSYLSGGERTAIALAYRLALNQTINSLLSRIKTRDLVILDEPTDGFSEQQLDKMRDVLNQLKAKQLILVSHESKIESFVENIIKFRKEGGVTKVEK